jgi:hypothetical protein
MTAFSMETGAQLVTGVDFGRFQTIVDLGGNRGTFLAQILHNYPTIQHGIVFDLPHIINQYSNGEDFKSREIPTDRWNFVSGNIYDPSTIPPADAYVLKHILHDFNDEKCLEILSSIHQANENKKNSPTTIFIIEHVILPDGAFSNWQSRAFDMAMAALFDNARERTENEYKELLKNTGFEFKMLYPIQAPESVIEATLVQ